MRQALNAGLRIAGLAGPLSLAVALLAAPAAFDQERGDRWERDGNGRVERKQENDERGRGRREARPAQGRKDRGARPDNDRKRDVLPGDRRREARPERERRGRAEGRDRREARPDRDRDRRSEDRARRRDAGNDRDRNPRTENRDRRRDAGNDRDRHRHAQRWDRDRDDDRRARPDRDRRRAYERRGGRRWHRDGSHRAKSFHIPQRWHYRYRPHHRHLWHRHYGRVWWCGIDCGVPILFGFRVWTVETVVSHESDHWFPIWEALEYNRTGETSLWESDWGYVEFTPTHTFRSGYGPHGRDCRDFHRVVVRHHDGVERHYRGTACRTPYGEWQIVS